MRNGRQSATKKEEDDYELKTCLMDSRNDQRVFMKGGKYSQVVDTSDLCLENVSDVSYLK